MLKHMVLVGICLLLCCGASCQVTIGGDGDYYVKLSEATAGMTITATTADSSAIVVATIARNGQVVVLQEGQAVSVNGVDLLGPDLAGKYSATVPRLNQYKIVVNEPTRGVEETLIDAPPNFAIAAPTVGSSISLTDGFTLTWSNPDANLDVTVRLSQQETGQVKILGPISDTGTLQVTHDDLALFGQWPTLPLKLTKTAEATQVAGFAGANVKVELSQSISVVPAP